jgi:pimeloyl-ACP methyl ester carboxylesterase
MDRSSSFRRLEARMPEAAFISYDRRGYGGSTARPPSERFADQVADLFEVIGSRPVVALGHSFGGGVVLAAAEQRPDLIRAAVIWEPPVPRLSPWCTAPPGWGRGPDIDAQSPDDVAESFMRHMVSDRIWERLPAATRQARRDEGPALVAELRALRASGPSWDPTAVTIPVIVGTGGTSAGARHQIAAELAAALPHAELVTVPGADHGAHLSHPADLAGLLRRAAALAVEVGTVRRQVGTVGPAAAESGAPDEENPS